GGEAAAADGDDDDVDVGEVLEDLEADGALAGDDVGVVVGRDEGHGPFGDELPGDGLACGLGDEDDLGAVAAGRFDLQRGRHVGHDDGDGDAEGPAGVGEGLAVVAGGVRDHAGAAAVEVEAVQGVRRAAELEGADRL